MRLPRTWFRRVCGACPCNPCIPWVSLHSLMCSPSSAHVVWARPCRMGGLQQSKVVLQLRVLQLRTQKHRADEMQQTQEAQLQELADMRKDLKETRKRNAVLLLRVQEVEEALGQGQQLQEDSEGAVALALVAASACVEDVVWCVKRLEGAMLQVSAAGWARALCVCVCVCVCV